MAFKLCTTEADILEALALLEKRQAEDTGTSSARVSTSAAEKQATPPPPGPGECEESALFPSPSTLESYDPVDAASLDGVMSLLTPVDSDRDGLPDVRTRQDRHRDAAAAVATFSSAVPDTYRGSDQPAASQLAKTDIHVRHCEALAALVRGGGSMIS